MRLDLLIHLEFTIYLQFVFHPAQKVEFLGFILDSQLIAITYSEKQIDKIVSVCTILLQAHDHGIRLVVIIMLIVALPAVQYYQLSNMVISVR